MADHIERVTWLYLWIPPILQMRSEFEELNHLLQELHMDEVCFQRYFRLSRALFEDFLLHSAERRPVFTPNKDETQGNHTEQKIKDFSDSSGRQTALRNKLNFEACEDCLDVLMSLCSEVKENVDEDDSKTKGTLETENSSFQEYLDKLCSDQHFTQNVGSTLDVDYLTSVSLSDLEDPKQQLVTEDSDLLPVQTDPVTDETLQYLNSDPPHRKLEAEGRDSVEKSVCFSSPLLASHLLEEPAGSTVDNLSPSHEDNQSYAAACRTICPYCCFLLDDVSLSPSNPFKDNVPVSPPEKQTVKPPGLQGSPCDGVPSVPKTGEGRSDTQKRHTKKLQTEDKFVETVQAEERDTERETEPRFCVPGSSGLKDIYMEGKPEDKNPNSRETDESTPRRDPADLRKHRQFSGRRRLFKREENKTSTAEPEPSKTPQDLKEDQQEFKVPHEKPPSSCRETIEDKKHSSRKDESENVNAGMPRPKNTTDGRKTTQASPRRKPETSSENQLQSPSYSSPRKRRSETKDERGEKKKVTEKASTVPKVKTSRSRFVFSQTDRETRDRVAQRDSRQTPLKEKPEPRRPTEGPKSNAAKTHEKRPKSDKTSRQIQKDPGNLKPKAELEEEELQNDLVAPLKKHKQQHDINEIIQPVEYKLMGVKLHLTKCTDDERTTPRRKAKKKPSTG